MLDEALDVLVGLWSGEPFSYHGEYYHVDEVTLLPRARPASRIPIWVGALTLLKADAARDSLDGRACIKTSSITCRPDDVRTLKTFIEGNRLSQSRSTSR